MHVQLSQAPVVSPAPVVVNPAPVIATSSAYAGPGDVPWGWVVGGVVMIGAAALLISAISAASAPRRR